MEDIKEKKQEMRNAVRKNLEALSKEELKQKITRVENRLFGFANFLESKIALLYIPIDSEMNTWNIIRKSFDFNKIVVLPVFKARKHDMSLFKVGNLDEDLVLGERGILEPNPSRCKPVPLEYIDIAIIPGVVFDEKGGRIGTGQGYYDKLIPNLPITTRKVALALECQIVQQVPMDSEDRHVDIIVTDGRIIYKI